MTAGVSSESFGDALAIATDLTATYEDTSAGAGGAMDYGGVRKNVGTGASPRGSAPRIEWWCALQDSNLRPPGS